MAKVNPNISVVAISANELKSPLKKKRLKSGKNDYKCLKNEVKLLHLFPIPNSHETSSYEPHQKAGDYLPEKWNQTD